MFDEVISHYKVTRLSDFSIFLILNSENIVAKNNCLSTLSTHRKFICLSSWSHYEEEATCMDIHAPDLDYFGFQQ